MTHPPPDSLWLLSADVLSARLLVWIASFGRDAELTPEAHLYFADRYQRLALSYEARGRRDKAIALRRKADEHYRTGGGDQPPYAAAMAMPRPARFTRTVAMTGRRFDPPDDAA